jgi:hypothetical protein
MKEARRQIAEVETPAGIDAENVPSLLRTNLAVHFVYDYDDHNDYQAAWRML